MATNIPPHNLGEVIDGICAQIDQPSITIPELWNTSRLLPERVSGLRAGSHPPVFPYGRDSLRIRGRWRLKPPPRTEQIIITEIPFNVNRAVLEERIAQLVNEKILTEISGLRTNPMKTPACH